MRPLARLGREQVEWEISAWPLLQNLNGHDGDVVAWGEGAGLLVEAGFEYGGHVRADRDRSCPNRARHQLLPSRLSR